jgi:hypothetical protein
MEKSESIKELASALAKARGLFKPIVRDKTVSVTMKSGGKYTFKYAPLESILDATFEALTQNGLSMVQGYDAEKKQVETVLMHASGEFTSNRVPALVMDNGPQSMGSAITYARRYGVTLILCIAADDDDDGNGAEGNGAEFSQRQPQRQTPQRQQTQAPAKPAPETPADTRPFVDRLEEALTARGMNNSQSLAGLVQRMKDRAAAKGKTFDIDNTHAKTADAIIKEIRDGKHDDLKQPAGKAA